MLYRYGKRQRYDRGCYHSLSDYEFAWLRVLLIWCLHSLHHYRPFAHVQCAAICNCFGGIRSIYSSSCNKPWSYGIGSGNQKCLVSIPFMASKCTWFFYNCFQRHSVRFGAERIYYSFGKDVLSCIYSGYFNLFTHHI